MKALAAYIVTGRWQAILVTTVSGVLAFLILPMSLVTAAAVGLVTLHVGKVQGLQVLAISSLLILLFYQMLDMQVVMNEPAMLLLMLWLPCWLIAAVLQQTGNLGHALKVAALYGVCLLILVYTIFGDPSPWWLEGLLAFEALLEEAGVNFQELTGGVALQDIASRMTGEALALLVLGITASLLLARWWQSVLVHPGGFRGEFYRLRLGAPAALLTLGIMLLTRVLQGTAGVLATQMVMILLVPYMLTGLAVMHCLASKTGRSSSWLVAVYVILVFVPPARLFLAGGGLLDTWIDFRRRLGGSGMKH